MTDTRVLLKISELEERVEKLEKDSHPPRDLIADLVEAIKNQDPIVEVLKELINATIVEHKYETSPDRWED